MIEFVPPNKSGRKRAKFEKGLLFMRDAPLVRSVALRRVIFDENTTQRQRYNENRTDGVYW